MRLVTVPIIFVLALTLLVSTRRYLDMSLHRLGMIVGVNLNNIASDDYVAWIKSQSPNFMPGEQAIFLNEKVPSGLVQNASEEVQVLGDTPDDSKWIETDLSEQRLYLKENGHTVASFLVSTGKWAPTPTGEWRIWTKLRYTRMEGGSKALGTYYNLPNVPYVMYYDRGYSIHGAYWHNNFGQPMSHGCTNMRPEEAAVVFNWASVGTRVIVHE